MLRFKTIKISNFYSIESAVVNLQNGVYIVHGENLDVGSDYPTSNGSGKTTIVNALLQGLYNKNQKAPKDSVNAVNNFVTKKPYEIVIEFEKDGDKFIVNNSRSSGKITVTKNGKDISAKSISDNLTLIKNIIGYSYDTFASLVYLNHDALTNIFDITSKDNIVYQFFDINAVKAMEKSIKGVVKDLVGRRNLLLSKISTIKSSLSVLDTNYTQKTLSTIEDNINTLQKSLLQVQSSGVVAKLESLMEQVQNAKIEMHTLQSKVVSAETHLSALENQYEKLKGGICPTCGSQVKDIQESFLESITVAKQVVDVAKDEYEASKKIYISLKEEYATLKQKYDDKISSIKTKLQSLEAKKLYEQKLLTQFEDVAEKRDALAAEQDEATAEVAMIDRKMAIYDKLLNTFKSGKIVEAYLQGYTTVLNKHIKKVIMTSEFDIKVFAEVNKGKLAYHIVDGQIVKGFSQLSSGERVRVAFALLIATLHTIEELSGVSINFIALDEIFGTLDADGTAFVCKILDNYRDSKSLFIITHHDEVSTSFGDYIMRVRKLNGLSNVNVEEL